jgi:hypothetical protein
MGTSASVSSSHTGDKETLRFVAPASAEDRADRSSDPAAAIMEIKDSVLEPEASHCTLEQKKPEASHSSGSSDTARIGPHLSPVPEDYNMRKVLHVIKQKK